MKCFLLLNRFKIYRCGVTIVVVLKMDYFKFAIIKRN